jgi:quercetin dioxygenase-like cupin family protein
MRGLLLLIAAFACLGTAPLHAQPGPQVKVTMLIPATPVTGVPDKVFVLLTTDFPPGVSTGRHTHPGDEYGTLMEGSVMTRQEGGDWKTVNAGESYFVPANIIHETKNVGLVQAKAVNAFVLEKDKPRVTAVPGAHDQK